MPMRRIDPSNLTHRLAAPVAWGVRAHGRSVDPTLGVGRLRLLEVHPAKRPGVDLIIVVLVEQLGAALHEHPVQGRDRCQRRESGKHSSVFESLLGFSEEALGFSEPRKHLWVVGRRDVDRHTADGVALNVFASCDARR